LIAPDFAKLLAHEIPASKKNGLTIAVDLSFSGGTTSAAVWPDDIETRRSTINAHDKLKTLFLFLPSIWFQPFRHVISY
jgi:hypothetical protein